MRLKICKPEKKGKQACSGFKLIVIVKAFAMGLAENMLFWKDMME